MIEDRRHVSGPFERFLIDHGERVARLAPHLMAPARTHVGRRGKSDAIDALSVARAALAHGLEHLPTARLAGIELEIRLIHQHHQRLIKQRTDGTPSWKLCPCSGGQFSGRHMPSSSVWQNR